MPTDALHIQRLITPEQFDPYHDGIQAILALYQHVLLDDFNQPPEPTANTLGWLTENTRSCRF